MAYTIQSTPAAYSSVHDDVIFTVAYPDHTSDPVTYPNYKFIADVYVGATLVARIKKVQDPSTGIGVFNIGQVIRNYLATAFNPTAGALVAQQIGTGQFWLSVQVKFGEEYAFTSYYNLVTDSARVYFNNYNGRLLGTTSSLVGKTNKVVSNRPTIGQTFLSSSYNFIPYFPTSTSAVSVIITPSGGGSTWSTSITPANANDLQVINVAPVAINAAHPGTINASTTSYTVQIGSETYTFKIICEAQYTPYTLHFLNQYGGFESKIFSKVSRRSYDVERKDFGKLPYTVDSNGAVAYKNSNGVYNESRSVYAVQQEEKLSLNSDLLVDAEYTWLRDLVFSPMVYIEDGGYLFPCVIKANNYELRKNVNDDLTSLQIDVNFGTQLSSQYR